MYTGDRATSTGPSENEASPISPEGEGGPELGRGIEVIELANGETIWLAGTFTRLTNVMLISLQVNCQWTS